MSNFDLRTREQKDGDKVHAKVQRDLDNLNTSYIPVESYEAKDKFVYPTRLEGSPFSDYFFADRDLRFIHCMGFDEKGNRIRRWVLNILKVDKVFFKTNG